MKIKNNNVHRNNFEIDSRMLLKVKSSEEIFSDVNYGLNEVTVLKQDTSSMITCPLTTTELTNEGENQYGMKFI